MTMNYYYSLSVIGAMDHLWFHQIVLFPEPNSLLNTKKASISEETSKPQSIPKYPSCPSPRTLPISTLPDEGQEFSSLVSLISDSEASSNSSLNTQDDSNNEEEEEEEEEEERQKQRARRRATRLSRKGLRKCKSMSFKSLRELELEEVKGFMDLGFIFKKEHLSPKMLNLLPGLQRLNKTSNNPINNDPPAEEEEERREDIKRPYLSEAWIMKRSSLIDYKTTKICSSVSDMKKHIRFWARTIASEIQQEC